MDLNNALIRSHRNNLARYRRLLATQLTELERDYINRRIVEERDALQQLLHGGSTKEMWLSAPSGAAKGLAYPSLEGSRAQSARGG